MAVYIQSSNTGRGKDDQVFRTVAAAVVEQRGFSGTGFSGYEKGAGGLFDDVEGFLKAGVNV